MHAVLSVDLSLLRYISRCLLIPFLNEIEYNLAAVEEVNRLKPTLCNALPALLRLGQKLVCRQAEELQSLKATALKATANTIDERLAVGYAMLLWVTVRVSCAKHMHGTDFINYHIVASCLPYAML